MELAEEVKTARLARGLTQRQLADILGVDRNFISMVEGGRRSFSERLRIRFDAWLKADGLQTDVNRVTEVAPEDIPAWAESLIDRIDKLTRDVEVVKTALLRLATVQLGRNPLEPEE